MGDQPQSSGGAAAIQAPAASASGADRASLEVHSGVSAPAQQLGDTAASAANASPAVGQDPDRPTDEQILSYENQIREEQRDRPLLGEKEPLNTLKSEYSGSGTVFAPKIRSLVNTYRHFRRTRQDGNCFYRSFLFGVLETLITTRNAAGAAKLVERVRSWKAKLLEAGYQELVFEDALDLLVEYLNEAKDTKDPLTIGELAVRLNNENVSNLMIMFIRIVTSAEIQRRAEFFTPFILGVAETFMETEDFCRRYVECMGEESDHIQLVAVADAFQVPIRIVYLDNSGTPPADANGELPCDMHEFTPSDEATDVSDMPRVTSLYRPGHYDILYEDS